jgi:tetratricopeptide (TPR) repeat protein
MQDALLRPGLPFGDGERTMDVTLPPGAGKRPVPAVVFANVTGLPFGTWETYRDWARLVAAHGMAGVVYTSDRENPARSLDALMTHLAANGAALGIDPSRIAVWACSANVSLALPWLMEKPRPGVAAAVLYYGNARPEPPSLRADLPVFYVLAGRDNPQLNEGIRAHFAKALAEKVPWTMVQAPRLTHAFDALDEGVESRRLVKETVSWLVDRLAAPPSPGPAPDAARAALTHLFGNEPDEAAALYRRILEADPKDAAAQRALSSAVSRGGLMALFAKDYPTAIARLEEALPKVPEAGRPNVLYNLACAYALSGRKDEALDRLGKAVEAGFGPRATIEGDEDLASLRAEARFAEIVKRARP